MLKISAAARRADFSVSSDLYEVLPGSIEETPNV